MTNDKCNIGNLDQKIDMLKEQFDQCVSTYHTPNAFMAQVDALIQGLRNYTFAVQANKKNIPNFDKWYQRWQERMKNEEYLLWLNQTRVDVVHGDVLTTKSTTILTLNTDHAETLTTKYFEIMTTTEDIIENAQKLADEYPALKHAAGVIERHYLFDIKGANVNALDLLGVCFAFMLILRGDLARYINKKKILNGGFPPLKGKFQFPPDELRVIFKLRNGNVITPKIKSVPLDKTPKKGEIDKHYGDFMPTNRIRCPDKWESARWYFELARKIFETDGHHIPIMHVHDKEGWRVVIPLYRDRAEKIVFWREFSKKIKNDSVDKLVFITESWTYPDIKKGVKHILNGKEIRTLRNKGEVLQVSYIDKDGDVIVISAPITKTADGVLLGETTEETCELEDYSIFYPVFAEWGLLERFTMETGDDTHRDL